MIIGLTGATGNIGREVVKQLFSISFVSKIKILVRPKKLNSKEIVEFKRVYGQKLEIIPGDLNDIDALNKLIDTTNIFINLAGVIPPNSDHYPELAIETNVKGVQNLINVIEEINPNVLFIHFSSIAVYGNRNHIHPYVEVGSPLLPSVGDVYAISKLRAEYLILESDLDRWVILRESAVLHDNLMKDNLKDGLMFHTCFNSPLEWITSRDTANLLYYVTINFYNGVFNNKNFYKKVFNLGNKDNRVTGYETFNEGFKMLGATAEAFFEPRFNAQRNFHGAWLRDSDKIYDLLEYKQKTEDISSFWDNLINQNKIVKLGKLVPNILIKKFFIERLLKKDENSPYFWVQHNYDALVIANFISYEDYKKLPKKFDNYYLFCKDENYSKIRQNNNYQRINFYFDTNKNDDEIDIEDLQNVAKAHGGELLSSEFKTGDIYQKLKWKTQDNEEFIASPYTILRAGHWYNPCYYKFAWDFDRLAKKDKIYSQVWYDSHSVDENNYYYLDENYKLCIKSK